MQNIEELKGTPISLRMKPGLKEKLLMESKKKNVSMSNLLNQILIDHVNWNEPITQLRHLSITRLSFRYFLEMLKDEEIIKFSVTIGKDEFQSTVSYIYGKCDLDSVIKYMETWLQFSHISYNPILNHGLKYSIKHDLGKKWSLLFLSTLKAVLDEIGFKIMSDNMNGLSLSFEIVRK